MSWLNVQDEDSVGPKAAQQKKPREMISLPWLDCCLHEPMSVRFFLRSLCKPKHSGGQVREQLPQHRLDVVETLIDFGKLPIHLLGHAIHALDKQRMILHQGGLRLHERSLMLRETRHRLLQGGRSFLYPAY
jgi:hypothetical protein